MTPAYALTIELPQPLAAAIDTLRAACEMATAALQRVVARLAQGIASPAASAT